jgi:TPM domain
VAVLPEVGDTMSIQRFFQHIFATQAGVRRKFTASVLDAIEGAVKKTEALHGGEIRIAIEGALSPAEVMAGLTPHERSLQVFSHLRVWDTDANNGVLIYVLLADRQVEIVADRGFNALVTQSEWEAICQSMEQSFAREDYQSAVVGGLERVGALIARHFPAVDRNELPDRPTIL